MLEKFVREVGHDERKQLSHQGAIRARRPEESHFTYPWHGYFDPSNRTYAGGLRNAGFKTQATYGLNDESTGDLCECLLAIFIFGKPEGARLKALDAFEQYLYAYSRYVWKCFQVTPTLGQV